MKTKTTIKKRSLIRAFAVLDEWFDKVETFHQYKPPGKGMHVHDILEQAILTSGYMMTMIDGGISPSVKITYGQADDVNLPLSITASRFLKQMQIQQNKLLALTSLSELRREFRDYLDRCLCCLELAEHADECRVSTDNEGKMRALFQCVDLLELYLLHYAEQLNKIEEKYLIQPA